MEKGTNMKEWLPRSPKQKADCDRESLNAMLCNKLCYVASKRFRKASPNKLLSDAFAPQLNCFKTLNICLSLVVYFIGGFESGACGLEIWNFWDPCFGPLFHNSFRGMVIYFLVPLKKNLSPVAFIICAGGGAFVP